MLCKSYLNKVANTTKSSSQLQRAERRERDRAEGPVERLLQGGPGRRQWLNTGEGPRGSDQRRPGPYKLSQVAGTSPEKESGKQK